MVSYQKHTTVQIEHLLIRPGQMELALGRVVVGCGGSYSLHTQHFAMAQRPAQECSSGVYREESSRRTA